MGSTRRESSDALLGRDLDQRISEMRELLTVMRPTSTATALKALRDSFPDIPLDQRIRVLAEARS